MTPPTLWLIGGYVTKWYRSTDGLNDVSLPYMLTIPAC
jgi:hypothetical protein